MFGNEVRLGAQVGAALRQDVLQIIKGIEGAIGERLICECPEMFGGLEFG